MLLNILPEIMYEIAMLLSARDVRSLYLTSTALHRLYQKEMFWRLRLQRYYPSYIPQTPITLTFKDYYLMLNQVWAWRDKDNKHVMLDMNNKSITIYHFKLYYPVPPFHEGLFGDVVMHGIPTYSQYVLVSIRSRESIIGTIPTLGESMTSVDINDLDVGKDKILGNARILQRLKYHTRFFQRNELSKLIVEAKSKGYVCSDTVNLDRTKEPGLFF